MYILWTKFSIGFPPTEALTHAPISCVLNICADNGIAAEDVAEVRIQTLVKAADILSDPSKYDPQTRETADHSLPYCIAAALAYGRVSLPNMATVNGMVAARHPAALDH